jgi:general secretion pathway protein A
MMFTPHFKMTRQPFPERAPIDQILRDERLSEGLARLDYLAQTGSIGVVTGHTGVGKSSLLKLFVHSLSRSLFQPIYLSLTHVDAGGLLRLIVTSLGEMPRRGKERLFLEILQKVEKTELTTLLIVDEAHLIPSESLTDLRLLVSAGLDEGPRLKILLAGQQPLREQLKSASYSDLVHRISVRYHIPPLTREQTASYIDFHMRTAGASERVFDQEAKYLLHDYASGIPRQINSKATACLLNAATKNVQKITDSLVNETMSEFRLP